MLLVEEPLRVVMATGRVREDEAARGDRAVLAGAGTEVAERRLELRADVDAPAGLVALGRAYEAAFSSARRTTIAEPFQSTSCHSSASSSPIRQPVRISTVARGRQNAEHAAR